VLRLLHFAVPRRVQITFSAPDDSAERVCIVYEFEGNFLSAFAEHLQYWLLSKLRELSDGYLRS
jgi:hypothetical protein